MASQAYRELMLQKQQLSDMREQMGHLQDVGLALFNRSVQQKQQSMLTSSMLPMENTSMLLPQIALPSSSPSSPFEVAHTYTNPNILSYVSCEL